MFFINSFIFTLFIKLFSYIFKILIKSDRLLWVDGFKDYKKHKKMKRNDARGRGKKTTGGGKGQPASGSAINYKVALGSSESAHS